MTTKDKKKLAHFAGKVVIGTGLTVALVLGAANGLEQVRLREKLNIRQLRLDSQVKKAQSEINTLTNEIKALKK
jgi:hypothetical protein